VRKFSNPEFSILNSQLSIFLRRIIMAKFIIWDKKSNLTFPNGMEYTPEEIMTDLTTDEVKARATRPNTQGVTDEIQKEMAAYGKARLGLGFGFTKVADAVLEQDINGKITSAVSPIHYELQTHRLNESLSGQAALTAIIAAKDKQDKEHQEILEMSRQTHEIMMQFGGIDPRPHLIAAAAQSICTEGAAKGELGQDIMALAAKAAVDVVAAVNKMVADGGGVSIAGGGAAERTRT
jgi:hypothetical protein